jgi:uncharacterized protein YuzE
MKNMVYDHRFSEQSEKAAGEENKDMAAAEKDIIEKTASLAPHLLNIPKKKIWFDYDDLADVLYINFKKPSHADDSNLTDDDIIVRYEKGEIVGITFLNASKRRSPINPL